MSITFNADELFEVAEQIERNGAAFYRRAAAGSQAQPIRELLTELAEMEVRHEETFADMRTQLTDADRKPTVFDPDDLVPSYLRALAQDKVFDTSSDPTKKLTGRETKEHILRTAIGLEKDSIVFYLGMKEVVPERLGREKVDAIIKQEMGHIVHLTQAMGGKTD